jgi:hypothetical protein
MNEEQLIQISQEIDEALLNVAEKHDANFLSFAALVLARLSRLSIDLEQQEVFVRLMKESCVLIGNIPKTETPNIH